jgi:hypothetical protein
MCILVVVRIYKTYNLFSLSKYPKRSTFVTMCLTLRSPFVLSVTIAEECFSKKEERDSKGVVCVTSTNGFFFALNVNIMFLTGSFKLLRPEATLDKIFPEMRHYREYQV